jgi:hypothetical protein
MSEYMDHDNVTVAQDRHEAAVENEPVPLDHEAPGPQGPPAAGDGTVELAGAADTRNATATDWHAEAGRKGANRVNQLIRRGLLYEQEHGLKSGRQRLRQLIDEGKIYEQEHGMRPERRSGPRGPRVDSEEVLRSLVSVLIRIAKPAYRDRLNQLLRAMATESPA